MHEPEQCVIFEFYIHNLLLLFLSNFVVWFNYIGGKWHIELFDDLNI